MKDQVTARPLQTLDAEDRHRVLTEHPGHLFRRSYQIFLYCFDEAMAGLKLSPVTWIMLATAHSFPGLSVTELARRAVIDKASCGRSATALEKRGLVRIKMSESDGRQKLLDLTPAGEALVAKGFGRIEKMRALLVGQLDAEEQRQLMTALMTFVQRSSNHVRASIPQPLETDNF